MIKLSQPSISEEAISRVVDILRSGQLVHGQECLDFECELAEFLGVKHALVVSSGTAALHVALLALDIGPGDAVIVPDFTFAATANIVEMTGAKAVIVDVDPSTYNMDSVKLEMLIESWDYPEKLKAIMPVLEFGNPSDIGLYREIADRYNLALIEDAACAMGAFLDGQKIGTFGDFACFSFHPRKTLTTGEGGLIVTNDDKNALKASLLRNHGMQRTEQGMSFKMPGLNYRLTNFQAAIGRDFLRRLPAFLEKRFTLAKQYDHDLLPLVEAGKIRLPNIEEGHSCQTYMIVLTHAKPRAEVIAALRERGVESNLGAQSMSALRLFQHSNNMVNMFTVGNELFEQGLALPLHEGMTEKEVGVVSECLRLTLQ